jgi:hypothetical protein
MLKVQNTTQQPLLIHRGKASPLHLLARGTAVLEEEEAGSAQVRALIADGFLEARTLATPSVEDAERKQSTFAGRIEDETGEMTPTKTED